MNKQLEYINELIRLKIANPNAKILFMVDTDMFTMDYSRIAASCGKPTLERYTVWEEQIIIDDDEYIKEEIAISLFEENIVDKETSKSDLEVIINEHFNKVIWKKGIFIDIG